MAQSRLASFVEANVSTAIGFVVSMIIGHFAYPGVAGCAVSLFDNFLLTLIFTVASIIRGYYVRRYFNGISLGGTHAKHHA